MNYYTPFSPSLQAKQPRRKFPMADRLRLWYDTKCNKGVDDYANDFFQAAV